MEFTKNHVNCYPWLNVSITGKNFMMGMIMVIFTSLDVVTGIIIHQQLEDKRLAQCNSYGGDFQVSIVT